MYPPYKHKQNSKGETAGTKHQPSSDTDKPTINWFRFGGIVIGTVSFVAAIITIAVFISTSTWSNPIALPLWIPIMFFLSQLLLVFAITVFYLRSQRYRRNNQQLHDSVQQLIEELDHTHRTYNIVLEKCQQEYTKLEWDMRHFLLKAEMGYYKKHPKDFERDLRTLLDRVNALFDRYLGNSVHVCLKRVWQNDEGTIMVKTRLRDHNTLPRLGGCSEITQFRYEASTALIEMIDNNARYFLRNNIPADAKDYKNPRIDWFRYYDSTVGVPVRGDNFNCDHPSFDIGDPKLTFGGDGNTRAFLFLDNLGGGFDKHCVNTLINIARHLYLLLEYDPSIDKLMLEEQPEEEHPKRVGS